MVPILVPMDTDMKIRMSPPLGLYTIANMFRENHRISVENENIRNITFDHIYLKAECSAFFAGEENTRIENVRMEDFCITMCKQGTQDSGFFDE